MIFITGGVAQGKTAFAQSFENPIIDNLDLKIKKCLETDLEENLQLPQKELEEKIRLEIMEWIKVEIESTVKPSLEKTSIDTLTEEEVWEAPVVIICREIGCGIVPMNKLDSVWREITGRSACFLAKKAKEVYKMELGIGVKIK